MSKTYWARLRGHPVSSPWEIDGDTAKAIATVDGKSTWVIQKITGGYALEMIRDNKVFSRAFLDEPTMSAAILSVDRREVKAPEQPNDQVNLVWGGLAVDALGD